MTVSPFGTSPRVVRALLILVLLLLAAPVRADVFGRLHISVTDSGTKALLSGVVITLHDSAGVRGNIIAVTDRAGSAITEPLENRSWDLTTSLVGYVDDNRSIQVVADTTVAVDVALVAKVTSTGSSRIRLSPQNITGNASHRDLNFLKKIPATAGNPQNLGKLLLTNPGFIESTVNVIHPRGEHASTTIYIDGAIIPGALLGRAGQLLNPNVVQSADILTGAYAPEYGSETAAVLNLNLRAGTIKPFQDFSFDSGTFDTLDQELTLGGQAGSPMVAGDSGNVPKRFRYLLDVSNRTTDNALEPPQPDQQDAHNEQKSLIGFGNFEYSASKNDQLSVILNSSPASTQIANRTGLSSKYAAVGQGYGYGGARNASGVIEGAPADSVGYDTGPIGSQQADGQDVYQNDDNSLGILNYRHTFSHSTTGLLTLGANHAGLDLKNNNPLNSHVLNLFNPDGTLQQTDNSIEYNPYLSRESTEKEFGGSVTQVKSAHVYKAGFLVQDQIADDEYQFSPESQLALDGLYASGDSVLLPAGHTNGETDANGFPVYLLNGAGESAPMVRVHKSGLYGAGYLQDTWQATRLFSANYGVRLDNFQEKQTLEGTATEVNETRLSPRLNTAYVIHTGTIMRLAYNRLFTQPPITQGSLLGGNLKPETLDQYDASVERQVAPRQSAKLAYYYKNIRNQNDTGILIPYTQIGAYTTLQYQYASIHGLEFSYNVTPRNNVGWGGYANYTYSHARPGGLDQDGDPAPIVNDHDQRNTIGLGADYTLRSQLFAGADFYYGSGEASSSLVSVSGANELDNGDRNAHCELNLSVGDPILFGHAGLELDVANVFNTIDVLNFNSGFSGTRFEQARRVILRVSGAF